MLRVSATGAAAPGEYEWPPKPVGKKRIADVWMSQHITL